MRVSVILSTYNQPDWLELVLWGYSVQSDPGFEILIADDGSTQETHERIADVRRWTALPIRHLWHPHRGFQKCSILNSAIDLAEGEYLIFSDGDCIPRRDFVRQHVRLAEPGRFLSGGAVRLPTSVSRKIRHEDVLTGRATQLRWLRMQGLTHSRKSLLLACPLWLAGVLDVLTPTRATFNGGNASAWKADLLRVNGFDERLRHGGLDRELGERLENAGVRGKQIRHRAVCVHLDHLRRYATPTAKRDNDQIRRRTRRTRSTWTPYGIARTRRAA